MEIRISLPFFPGFDDEALLSLYEYCDPEEWVIDVKLSEVQEKLHAKELTFSDLTFNQKDYERDAKSTWIEEWGKSAPKDVVETVEAETGYSFNPNVAWAKVKLKDGWQDVMRAFMQDNDTWLKENCDQEHCGQEHYLESQEFENWPKYLFEDYDRGAIADMIGLMMLRDYDDIDDISYNLIAGALNNIDIRSYVFLNEEGLAKLVEGQLVECDGNEQDEEIRILSNVKKWYEILTTDGSDKDYISSLIDINRREYYLDSLQTLVENIIREKYRQEWYKNYIGTRKLEFDGPLDYKETDEINDEDISSFMLGDWSIFLNYRLKVGHTDRQDRFTALMRNYPQEVLDWMQWQLPYLFYNGLAKGGEYELYGCSKGEFIDIVRDESDLDPDSAEILWEGFEYAAVLEEEYGIDYAVDYLYASDWKYWYVAGRLDNGTTDFIEDLFSRAVSVSDNAAALMAMGDLSMTYLNYDPDFSIEMYARLATIWKKRLINDHWLTNDFYGLPSVFDWEWGEEMWEEDEYPENPEEDMHKIWLIKLLESDFAYDIADYLKPLLKMVLEKEKNHNWETGKKAIESFLEKISNSD